MFPILNSSFFTKFEMHSHKQRFHRFGIRKGLQDENTPGVAAAPE
jgi:hypothetical protein